jgi:flagellar motor switch/type III secretory pathway protein FliN
MTEEEKEEMTKAESSNLSNSQMQILHNLSDTRLTMKIVVLEEMFTIGELMALSPGSILQFDVEAASGAWLSVNDRKFAAGNVVQVGDQYGFQISTLNN